MEVKVVKQQKGGKTIVFAETPQVEIPKFTIIPNNYELTLKQPGLTDALKKVLGEYNKAIQNSKELWDQEENTYSNLNNYIRTATGGYDFWTLPGELLPWIKKSQAYKKQREALLKQRESQNKADSLWSVFYKHKDNPISYLLSTEFQDEAKNLIPVLGKDNVEIHPIYGTQDTTKIKNVLSKITPNENLVLLGHSGHYMGGIRNEWWNRQISKCNPKDFLIGSCGFAEHIEEFPDVPSVYYRPSSSWLGINPKAENLIDAMYSRWGKNGVYGTRKPKYGEDYIKTSKEMAQYKKGGKWIQKAVNPEHKGYCTPMTKPTCTPHRKALARRFKAMARARKHEEGGLIDFLMPLIEQFKCGGKMKAKETGGRLTKSYIKEARTKAGGSNVGKKTFASGEPRKGPYVGPSGGAPKGSYPIPDLAHAKSAIRLSGHAPNPEGIKSAVYRKFPQLKKKKNGGKIDFDISHILALWKK